MYRPASVPHLVHRPHILAKGLVAASHPPGAALVPRHCLQLGLEAAALVRAAPHPRVAVPVRGEGQELLTRHAPPENVGGIERWQAA